MSPAEFARASAQALRHVIRRNVLHVVEPIKGPWTNNNLWGDQRFKPLPESEGQVVEVLPKNTHLYGPPMVHSVQLARSDEVLPENADVHARVQYGCGGVNNEFDCDWLHGQQFTIVCNSLSVRAITYRPIERLPYNAATGAIALRASIAKGSINPNSQGLTFTESTVRLDETGVVGGTSSVNFAVRDFVKSFTVHLAGTVGSNNSNPTVATGIIIEIFTVGSGQLALYDAQVCAGGLTSIRLPGDTTNVVIQNTNGGLSHRDVTMVWNLGL